MCKKNNILILSISVIILIIIGLVIYKTETIQQFNHSATGDANEVMEETPKDKPVFLSASIEPKKVAPGDNVIVTVEIKDNYGINEVKADMGEIAYILLELIEGDINQGIWRGNWLAHDTKPQNYQTMVFATNAIGKQSSISINWEDPTITDSFTDETKIASKTNITISGGQAKLAESTLNESICNSLSGWYWFTTNGRSACWSKTLADEVSWNKGAGNDTDNPGAFTCATGYSLQQRMQAASAGEWYKIVSEVNSVTITSSHNGSAGYPYISALAIADCVDGTRDLCTGDGCTGATDWSGCCSYYRTWAGASGKSALPYLSTDAGTTQATNDYWDACSQSGTEDQTLGCSSGNNYFYLNRKACDDDGQNYSWVAACGFYDGGFWDTRARMLGYIFCSFSDGYFTSYNSSFRVVVRPE